jgi:1-acyl-sn-glycerol-3-phosphate acyltransferase
MIKNIRAGLRMLAGVAAVPVFIALTALQGFVVGPLTGNTTAIPNLLYKTLGGLLGYKIVFNKASAPIVKDKPVWFVANHLSIADFIVLGSKLDGTFAGKGDVLKWPFIAQMAHAVKYIGLRRSREFNPQSRAKIVKNFNQGMNTIMFPEGTTSDGREVHLFRAALPSLLYGEPAVDDKGNAVSLNREVAVQPVAIRVLKVGGKDAVNDDTLRNLYSMPTENNTLRRLWKRMQIRQTVLELTVFPAMAPSDYKDAMELMNETALKIATVVNPGQTTFAKAEIPGQKK